MKRSGKKQTTLLPRRGGTSGVAQISDRERDVLEALAAYNGWARPMDVGGKDGSHHSATLGQLAGRGLVERKKLHAIYCYNGSTQRQKLVDNRWVVTYGHPALDRMLLQGELPLQDHDRGSRSSSPMRAAARLVAELILLGLLSGVLLVAVIVIYQQIIDDEKAQYFLIGYYVAIHHGLARWIWKRLRIEKEPAA